MSPPRFVPSGPVVLVGLMGCGKSTVGRLLAKRWQLPFVDLDHEIEARAARSVAEIFANEGEAGFRAREAEATRALDTSGPVVVAVGGGWMARPELRDAWPGAIRIWLRISPREAARRLAPERASRPLLANESPEAVLQELLDARLPSYGLSEYTVGTSGRTPAEVADLVEDAIRGSGPDAALDDTEAKLSTES